MKLTAAIRLIFLYTALLCWRNSFSQNRELDSLSVVFNTAKEDTVKIRALKRMVYVWADINTDSAKHFINLLRSMSEKAKFPEGIIYADVKLAELYNYNGDFAIAMNVNNKNLAYAQARGTPYQQADVHKTIAMNYSMQDKNDSALHYYLTALKIYENNNDSLYMARVMGNVAVVHYNMGDIQKAIDYCKRAKEIFKNKDRNAYRVVLTNLALYQGYDKQFEEAKITYKEALAIAETDNNVNSMGHIYSGLMDIAYLQKQYPLMIDYAHQFEKVATDLKFDVVILRAKMAMGKALFYNHRITEAEKYFTDVLNKKDQLEDNLVLKDAYSHYSYLLLQKGDLKAFDNYKQKIDSLTALENKEVITRATKEFETKYETEKKDNQIKLQSASLQQKQLWNYFLIGALIALAIIGFISFRNYRHRQMLAGKEKVLQQQKIEQLEKEKQLTATQAVLQGQDEERSRLAKDLHDGLGGMLSGVKFSFTNIKENMIMSPENQLSFARSMDMLDGIIYELRRVAHNMMPESLIKFGLDASLRDMCTFAEQTGNLRINYQSLGLDGITIDKNIGVNIYRIIQELLNNIMKHAKATEALVQVVYKEGHFAITVEDNGSGFDISSVKNRQKETGIGWMNIQNRVDSLKGVVNVESSAQKGTSVFIEFNI